MHHERPVRGDFAALACAPEEAAWARFMHTLERRGRARCTLEVQLLEAQERKAHFEGEFVALAAQRASSAPAS